MKTENIYLKWAKIEKENFFNFGDDLAPYIINKLSGKKIEYIHFASTRLNVLKLFLLGIINGRLTYSYFLNFFKSFIINHYIISIGSIIQWYGSSRCIVWGSGILNRKSNILKSTFLAVRGKYTQVRLKELGFHIPEVIGDPSLLLPLVYTSNVKKNYRLGIIPHIIHFDFFKDMVLPNDILLINLNTNDIEDVIDKINSCEYTISSSLHGLIVSHSYNIKSLWFKIDSLQLAGDNIKFYDYFSSVKIPEYEPIVVDLENELISNMIIDLIDWNDDKNEIKTDIKVIQKQLINVAPFFVKSEFTF